MLTQRWLFGENAWRPGDEPARARDWEVVRVQEDAPAKAFVTAHHYAHSYVAARERFALVHAPTARTMGYAVFDVPAQPKMFDVLAGPRERMLHLGRLILLPEAPGNCESLFVAEAFRQLRRESYAGVVSFSDPMPRQRADGTVVMPGHVGIVYQSLNAVLKGRSKPGKVWLLPDGTTLAQRAQSKVKKLEQGWRYVVRSLVAHGAEPLEVQDEEDPEEQARAVAWLEKWRGRLCRVFPHPGNWKYVWGLDRTTARLLDKGCPYPEPPGGRVRPKYGRRAA